MSDETEKSITIKKSDLWKYSTFLLLIVVLVGVVFLFKGNGSPGTTGGTVDTGEDTESGIIRAQIDDDAMIGDENAPVTIIEFSDYQCPYCRKHWTETYSLIKSQYIDIGKVRLVFRDLPLTGLHPMAMSSAIAAECVREKGGDEAYFEYHDKLFSEQNILDSGDPQGSVTRTVTYTTENLKTWAKEVGYDISSCLDSGKFASEVQKDISDATSSGFQGTPGFVVMKTGDSQGIALRGAYPFSSFQQAIESLL